MYIKFAQVSDIHLTSRLRWFDEYLLVLERIYAKLISNEVDVLLLTGDLSGRDAPHRMTEPERLAISTWVRKIAKHMPVVVIRGNHDARQELQILENCYPGQMRIQVFEQPSTAKITTARGDSMSISVLPWMSKSDVSRDTDEDPIIGLSKIVSYLREDNHENFKILAGHAAVVGEKLSESVVQRATDIVLYRETFADYHAVALGHFHIHNRRDNMWYCGSPVPLNIGETSFDHGFVIFDTEGNWRFEKIPSWLIQDIPIPYDYINENLGKYIKEYQDSTPFYYQTVYPIFWRPSITLAPGMTAGMVNLDYINRTFRDNNMMIDNIKMIKEEDSRDNHPLVEHMNFRDEVISELKLLESDQDIINAAASRFDRYRG